MESERNYDIMHFRDSIKTNVYAVSYFSQLNFIGVTVEAERNYIHFPASKHMFTPVPVGEKTSPKQVGVKHFQNLVFVIRESWIQNFHLVKYK